ncbi:hypothetical protein DV735_g2631, partial [Chaetothyriales sp. CBS 134920]
MLTGSGPSSVPCPLLPSGLLPPLFRARAYSTISENDLTNIGLLGGLNAACKLAREEFGETRLGFQQKTFDVLVVSGPALDRCGFPLSSELTPEEEDKDAAARALRRKLLWNLSTQTQLMQ